MSKVLFVQEGERSGVKELSFILFYDEQCGV